VGKNAVLGLMAAAALALALSPATIAGIDAWKIVLAVAGAYLFVTAGRSQAK
jgi:hypothetical protein